MQQFIPYRWLEQAAWNPGMVVQSYPIEVAEQYGPGNDSKTEHMIKQVLGL